MNQVEEIDQVKIIKTRQINIEIDERFTDFLLEEYKLCFSEYAYRDALSVKLFTSIIGLMTFLFASFAFIKPEIGHLNSLAIMLLGSALLFILHLDLMKTLSCKRAMHARAKEIERDLKEVYPDSKVFRIFESISSRSKYKLEFLFHNEISVGGAMLWISRIFSILWIAYYYDSIWWMLHQLQRISGVAGA